MFCNITFYVILLEILSYFQVDSKDAKLFKISKRNFLFKEREYLQERPLSDEMKSFIRKHKRTKTESERPKREDTDKGNMYVVQNEDIVPLNNLSPFTSDGEFKRNFTVLPLIIPIAPIPSAKYDANSFDTNIKISDAILKLTGEVAIEEQTTKMDEKLAVVRESIKRNNETLDQKQVETTHYTQKPDDDKFLNKILDDVQELIKYEKEGKSLNNEGALCNVNGDWDSDAAGMQLQIELKNDSHTIDVTLAEREPPAEGGFLCSNLWNISAQVPFNHSSLILLTAISTKGKRIATFIGECRICEGTETITGNWMIGRSSKNCKDREGSHTVLSDVLKKNNVRNLQHDHLRQLSTSTLKQN